jgi:hypothetical protein
MTWSPLSGRQYLHASSEELTADGLGVTQDENAALARLKITLRDGA